MVSLTAYSMQSADHADPLSAGGGSWAVQPGTIDTHAGKGKKMGEPVGWKTEKN